MDHGRKTLEQWRSEIDTLDAELLELLSQRAQMACEIAAIKVASGLPAYDPQRETQVLSKIAGRNRGPLDRQSIIAIFAGIVRETRRLGTQRMQDLAAVLKAEVGQHKSRVAIEITVSKAACEE